MSLKKFQEGETETKGEDGNPPMEELAGDSQLRHERSRKMEANHLRGRRNL
jgi:hypothetical protein